MFYILKSVFNQKLYSKVGNPLLVERCSWLRRWLASDFTH